MLYHNAITNFLVHAACASSHALPLLNLNWYVHSTIKVYGPRECLANSFFATLLPHHLWSTAALQHPIKIYSLFVFQMCTNIFQPSVSNAFRYPTSQVYISTAFSETDPFIRAPVDSGLNAVIPVSRQICSMLNAYKHCAWKQLTMQCAPLKN